MGSKRSFGLRVSGFELRIGIGRIGRMGLMRFGWKCAEVRGSHRTLIYDFRLTIDARVGGIVALLGMGGAVIRLSFEFRVPSSELGGSRFGSGRGGRSGHCGRFPRLGSFGNRESFGFGVPGFERGGKAGAVAVGLDAEGFVDEVEDEVAQILFGFGVVFGGGVLLQK